MVPPSLLSSMSRARLFVPVPPSSSSLTSSPSTAPSERPYSLAPQLPPEKKADQQVNTCAPAVPPSIHNDTSGASPFVPQSSYPTSSKPTPSLIAQQVPKEKVKHQVSSCTLTYKGCHYRQQIILKIPKRRTR